MNGTIHKSRKKRCHWLKISSVFVWPSLHTYNTSQTTNNHLGAYTRRTVSSRSSYAMMGSVTVSLFILHQVLPHQGTFQRRRTFPPSSFSSPEDPTMFNMRQISSLPVQALDIARATRSDPLQSKVLMFLRQGWPVETSDEFKLFSADGTNSHSKVMSSCGG